MTVLVDTNILVYAFDSSEREKFRKANELFKTAFYGEKQCAVSNQVLAEFFHVVTRKIENPLSLEDASLIVKKIVESRNWTKINYTADTVGKAVALAGKTPFWDALIIATMLENGITDIYTENVSDFSKTHSIKASNPLK